MANYTVWQAQKFWYFITALGCDWYFQKMKNSLLPWNSQFQLTLTQWEFSTIIFVELLTYSSNALSAHTKYTSVSPASFTLVVWAWNIMIPYYTYETKLQCPNSLPLMLLIIHRRWIFTQLLSSIYNRFPILSPVLLLRYQWTLNLHNKKWHMSLHTWYLF